MPATSNRASIKLYNVTGMGRMSGNDAKDGNGGTWLQQFYGEMEDSAIESWYMDDANAGKDLSRYPQATVNRKLAPYFDTCCICHRHISNDAWLCMDGGEMACDSHVKIVNRAE